MQPKLRLNDENGKEFVGKWKEEKLGDLVSIKTGKKEARDQEKNGKYNFYTSGKKIFKINSYVFKGPAILIAGSGATVGYSFFETKKFNANQRTFILFSYNIKNILFIYYSIKKNIKKTIHQKIPVGIIPNLLLSHLKNLQILLPPTLKEQQAIGSLFANIDQQIELFEKKIENAKQLKKGLLQRLFC